MKRFTYFLAVLLVSFSTFSYAQTCKNHVNNNSGNAGTRGWTIHGAAKVVGGATNKAFQVPNNDSHISQDITVPSGSKYVYLGGYTKNTKANAQTGQAYLYGYVMDGSDKILEYIQLGVKNTTTSWKFQSKVTNLTSSAKKIRLFLKRSNINGKTDVGNRALFDNLVVSFGCKAAVKLPICKNYLKNNQANNSTNHWTSYGSTAIANLAGGNKSFKVMATDAHFYQDVTIPKGSKMAYFGGWTRNSQASAPTGHAYLYGYIMDSNDKILDYVQLGVVNKTMKWTYQDKKVMLKAGATKVRFFLKKSGHATTADTGNMAHFDNLILSFDCTRKTKAPK